MTPDRKKKIWITGIVVLGMIAIVAFYYLVFMEGCAVNNDTRTLGDLENLKTVLMVYRVSNGYNPTTEQGLQALVTLPTTPPVPANWAKQLAYIPKDPWGQTYQYRCPGRHNPETFDIFSLGPDGVESEDDIGNWEQGK